MPDSQGFDQLSNSTAAKLLEVDSELAVQESQLRSLLESVQEKRRSLKTVISMFPQADTRATVPVESPVQVPSTETNTQPERVGENVVAPSLEISNATTTTELALEVVSPQSKSAKTKASSSSQKKQTRTKFTQKTNPSSRGSRWQEYVREEYSNTSLPQAVALVLQRQAERVLEIPAVVNAIFMEQLPNEIESKVRRQVTNILSDGARKNKWYRGQLGQYSMSKAAALAKSA